MKMGEEGPTTQRAAVHPTICNLAWAAGFMEGEASFKKDQHSCRICVAQVELEPLTRLLNYFGGRIFIKPMQKNSFNKHPQFMWRVNGARARGVMMTLFSLMSPRRQTQIKEAMI